MVRKRAFAPHRRDTVYKVKNDSRKKTHSKNNISAKKRDLAKI